MAFSQLTESNFLMEFDDKEMSVPNFESVPHLLISQVRKQYLEHIIKLLSVNYENHQKLIGKNIYLPSAIWRCAKYLENSATQMCMVVDLYRSNILTMVNRFKTLDLHIIKQLKSDTKKGRLYRPLLDCLQKPSENEKYTQCTQKFRTESCTCACTCNGKYQKNKPTKTDPQDKKILHNGIDANHIEKEDLMTDYPCPPPVNINNNVQNNEKIRNQNRISVDSQEQDQMMMQLEELFRDDNNDLEDLFEGGCNIPPGITSDDNNDIHDLQKTINKNMAIQELEKPLTIDDRLAFLESSGVLLQPKNTINGQDTQIKTQINPIHSQKKRQYKWICEEYYQKLQLLEKLDEIRENNRSQHSLVNEFHSF